MKRRLNSGFSLFEAAVTATMTTMVLGAGVGLYVAGLTNWARGERSMRTSDGSRQGVRKAVDELRLAMNATVDSDGHGVTFQKPKTDINGNFILPLVSDGIDRRLYYQAGKLMMNDGVNPVYVVVGDVILNDPFLVEGFNGAGRSLSTDKPSSTSSNAFQSWVNSVVSSSTSRDQAGVSGGLSPYLPPQSVSPTKAPPVYKIFTPSAGAVTRSVVVKVITMTTGGIRNAVISRHREEIFLRNVPGATR